MVSVVAEPNGSGDFGRGNETTAAIRGPTA